MACHDSTEPRYESEDPQHHECCLHTRHPLRLDEDEPHSCRKTECQAGTHSDTPNGRRAAIAFRRIGASGAHSGAAGLVSGNAPGRVAGIAVARCRFPGENAEHTEINLAAASRPGKDRREREGDALGSGDDRGSCALASGDSICPGQRFHFRQPTHAWPSALVARGPHAEPCRSCCQAGRHHQAHQLARISAHVLNLARFERGGCENGPVAPSACELLDHLGHLYACGESQEAGGSESHWFFAETVPSRRRERPSSPSQELKRGRTRDRRRFPWVSTEKSKLPALALPGGRT